MIYQKGFGLRIDIFKIKILVQKTKQMIKLLPIVQMQRVQTNFFEIVIRKTKIKFQSKKDCKNWNKNYSLISKNSLQRPTNMSKRLPSIKIKVFHQLTNRWLIFELIIT